MKNWTPRLEKRWAQKRAYDLARGVSEANLETREQMLARINHPRPHFGNPTEDEKNASASAKGEPHN